MLKYQKRRHESWNDKYLDENFALTSHQFKINQIFNLYWHTYFIFGWFLINLFLLNKIKVLYVFHFSICYLIIQVFFILFYYYYIRIFYRNLYNKSTTTCMRLKQLKSCCSYLNQKLYSLRSINLNTKFCT